jgi:predicted XRE-type DNA-binding protein
MSNKKKSTRIPPSGGSIFNDVVGALEEVHELQVTSKQRIADKVAIKHQLLEAITQWIAENQCTQRETTQLLGISSSRLADLLGQNIEEWSVDALVEMVLRTGKKIEFSIDPNSEEKK